VTVRLVAALVLLGCSDTVAQVITRRDDPTLSPSQLFAPAHPWTQSIAAAPVDARSDAMLAALDAAGGWGTSTFRIDFGAEVLTATADTPFRDFVPNSEFYDGCERVPFPLPSGGALADETGYRCTTDGDCFLLVLDPAKRKLYEMYKASFDGTTFTGGCAVVWDLQKTYGPYLRGKGCSSAEGGGLPVTPLLATADEVAAGAIKHALHLGLPNNRLRRGIYVSPASHSSGLTSAGPDGIPYGARFRLKASFDHSRVGARAAVLTRAMQEYGLFVASSGSVPLAVRSDRSTTTKWSTLGIDASTLEVLTPADFEVLSLGTPVDWLADTSCHREL
jgi:hypothetical protein